MSGIWWPLGAEYVCAAQSPRAQIHAVETMTALRTTKDAREDGKDLAKVLVRTVCGLDARLAAHTVWDPDGEPAGVMIATWPAPVVDRCEDCGRVTKIGKRERLGSAHFQRLIPTPVDGAA